MGEISFVGYVEEYVLGFEQAIFNGKDKALGLLLKSTKVNLKELQINNKERINSSIFNAVKKNYIN
ncbi:MAG: hypothetical protein GY714_14255 [Desulfobacterales bacterium]|nr:hypothetical protein [Desulfobacterales bacterium]